MTVLSATGINLLSLKVTIGDWGVAMEAVEEETSLLVARGLAGPQLEKAGPCACLSRLNQCPAMSA